MKRTWKHFGLMLAVAVLLAVTYVPAKADVTEWVDLGATNVSSANGLTCLNEAVALNTPDTLDGVECRKTVLGSNTFAFGIDDAWALAGNRRSVYIAIEYYDSTTQTLTLRYDSVDGDTTKIGGRIYRSGTNTWKTHLWYLGDAYFGNRQDLGSDFLISCSGVQTFINRVYIMDGRKKVTLDMGATETEAGLLRNEYASGGVTAVANLGGIDCRRNEAGSNYFYFDVEDGWASRGNRRDFYITVEYYDNGTGPLSFQYDSTQNGAYREAASFNRTNTNTWKTHTWYIKDAYFGDRQNGDSDFRIYGPDTFYLDKVSLWEGHKAIINLGSINTGHGLTTYDAGEGANTPGSIGGLDCRQIAAGNAFTMQVDDAFAAKGNRQDVYLTIHYYDSGTGSIALEYDSTTGAHKSAPGLSRTNTNTWKAHTWHITDAYFGNQQAGGADFRIASPGAPLYLDMVYVRDFQPLLRQRMMSPRSAEYTGGPKDPQVFTDLMTRAAESPDTWDMVGGVMAGAVMVFDFEPDDLRRYVADLQSWGMLLSLSIGALKEHNPDGTDAFESVFGYFDRWLALGATVDELDIDESLYAAIYLLGKDMDFATSETTVFLGLMRERYPNMKIGDIEPYPSLSPTQLKSWLIGMNDRCAQQGVEILDFHSLDANWTRFDPNHWRHDGSWMGCKSIRDSCADENMPFEMLYWASPHGAPGSGTDKDWYDDIMIQGQACLDVNLNPDRYSVASWLYLPIQTVGETDEWSFMKSVLDFNNKYCGFEPLGANFEWPETATYQYVTPWAWTGSGAIVMIRSGNSTWGGLASHKKDHHIALENLASVSRDVNGFVVGATYHIEWAEANRSGYLPNSLQVSIDSTVLEPSHTVTSTSWVVRESDTFIATTPTMTLKFETLDSGGDDRVTFIDAVMVKLTGIRKQTPSPEPSNVLQWDTYE